MAEEKIPNKDRGEVAITLGSPPMQFVLRPSLTAVQAIEQQLNVGLLKLYTRLQADELRIGDIAVIVTEGMKASGEPATLAKVTPMIYAAKPYSPAVTFPVMYFLINALSGGKEPETDMGEMKAAEATSAPASAA